MPHKVATVWRYKVSDDVLLQILGEVDPVSLYRTCKAFPRVSSLVNVVQSLQYKYELAVSGMLDGPVAHAAFSPIMRLQLLSAYKTSWPRLNWSNELRLVLPAVSTAADVSGDFLYHVIPQGLQLAELPSVRGGRNPTQTHHLRYITNPLPECIAVDVTQSLVIACASFIDPNGQVGLRLKIRNLWKFDDKHPKAHAPFYDTITAFKSPSVKLSASINASIAVISMELVDGSSKHLVMNWSTPDQVVWLDDQDVMMVSPHHLLGIRRCSQGKSSIALYNVKNLRAVTIAREYEMCPQWTKASIRFARNSSTNADITRPTNTLFYSDPAARVLVMTAKQGDSIQWLIVKESFFRPTPFEDRRYVPWAYWGDFCLVRNLPNTLVGQPQVVGFRVFYLEKPRRGRDDPARLNIIDFSPYGEEHTNPTKWWCWVGRYSCPPMPFEYHREIGPETTGDYSVESIRVTEDNVILFFETHRDTRPVSVLSFGIPSSRGARR